MRCFGGENLPEINKLPTEPICTPKNGWRIIYNKNKKCNPSNYNDDDDNCCITQPPKQITNYSNCKKEKICKNKNSKKKYSIKDYCDDNGDLKTPTIEVCNSTNDFKYVCPKNDIDVNKLCDYINWSNINTRDYVECLNDTPCYLYTESTIYRYKTNKLEYRCWCTSSTIRYR